jgi:hypothetical protein
VVSNPKSRKPEPEKNEKIMGVMVINKLDKMN